MMLREFHQANVRSAVLAIVATGAYTNGITDRESGVSG
jgi:hypothetical protein